MHLSKALVSNFSTLWILFASSYLQEALTFSLSSEPSESFMTLKSLPKMADLIFLAFHF